MALDGSWWNGGPVMRRARAAFVVVAAASLLLGCPRGAQQRTASPALAELCAAVSSGYTVIGGPPHGNAGKQDKLFRKLARPDELERMDAARKLLAHSECRVPTINESAIRVSGLTGDPRVVAYLAEIITQRGHVADPCRSVDDDDGNNGHGNDGDHDDDSNPGQGNGNHGQQGNGGVGDADDADNGQPTFTLGNIPYPLSTRTAAAAALGRILERGRVLVSDDDDDAGDDRDGDGDSSSDDEDDGDDGEDEPAVLSAEVRAAAIKALQLGSCASEDTRIRVASVEALGIARDPEATSFLDVMFAGDTGAPDVSRGLLLQAVAGRSLTNITHNNHLEESDVDEKLRELLLNLQQEQP